MQDWGSGLGFHYAMRNENNIKGLAFMGSGIHFVQEDNPHLIGTELANWYSNL